MFSWKPDTGLPLVGGGGGGGSSASAVGKSKVGLSGGVDALSRKKLPVVSSVWQREKGNGQVGGLLVLHVDPRKPTKLEKKNVKETAGSKWFDIPAATVTPEMKRELHLLRLRGALDPKRHCKANDSKATPKFFQVGTVVEGAADFYSGRLTKKERKLTFADELLTDLSLDPRAEGGGWEEILEEEIESLQPSWAKT